MSLKEFFAKVRSIIIFDPKVLESNVFFLFYDESGQKEGNAIPIMKGTTPPVGSVIFRNISPDNTLLRYHVFQHETVLVDNVAILRVFAKRSDEPRFRFLISFQTDGNAEVRGYDSDGIPEVGETILRDNVEYRITSRSHLIVEGHFSTCFVTERVNPESSAGVPASDPASP